jgi:uncharacterized phiE125 gp8 family phage protein
MITPKVITAPTAEPISLGEAKEHLRIDGPDEDALIQTYIKAARRHLEWRTGRTIIETVYEMTYDRWPSGALVLPRATPLTVVGFIKYTDSTGVQTTWSDTEYVLDLYNQPGCVKPAYGESWPSFVAYPVNPILVRYTAGADPSDAIDETLQIPIFLLVAGMFENREATKDIREIALEYGVEAFITQNIVSYAF